MKRVRRPCDACPWRKDAQPGRFDVERWESLQASSPAPYGPEFGSPLFACHKTPEDGERACAGWLASVGHTHPAVRFAIMLGDMPEAALEPGEDWPDLHETFRETALHDLDGRPADIYEENR